jgi:NADP-dependent 3-hydroxy acid dehydrogenase YdfG
MSSVGSNSARQPEQLADFVKIYGQQLRTVKLDIKSPEEAEKAIAAAVEAFSRIDVVVNNAGYGFIRSI